MYSFIPFSVLAIANILLIVDLHKRSSSTSETVLSISTFKKNQISISISVISLTLLFILFTCPSAIATQYYDMLIVSFDGKVILFSADCFAFSYHALNIIILVLFNKQFMRKFKEMFGFGKDRVQPNVKGNTMGMSTFRIGAFGDFSTATMGPTNNNNKI